MKLKKVLIGICVAVMLFAGNGVSSVNAGYDFTSMSQRDFILFMMEHKSYNEYKPYFSQPGFGDNYFGWFKKAEGKNNLLDESYPWAATSDAEYLYVSREIKIVNYGTAGEAFRLRADRYNREHGVYKEWERQQDISANKKMWSQSQLTGNPNSHGVLTQKDKGVYERIEGDTTIKGIDLGAGSYNMDEPSGVTKIIMEFLCWFVFFLADGLDSILSTGGIALDNVIFGRVAGYGVLPAGESDYVTLFGFELNNGNLYGYVGAMLFQRIRSYIYLFMAVYCLYKMVRIAASADYVKMKMDFSTFVQNALLSFSFIVLMPYVLDIYLYIRDILLKSVTFDSLQDLFGTTGFLASFRVAAQSSSLNIIPNFIYLGAVILSLVVAGTYIAYAMSMMVHFILFPFVCLRGIGDRNVYNEWAAETLGLTIMPLIDGIILIIPLTFSDMANGNLAFNLLSLVSCGMLLTARKQARRSLGIKDAGIDMGALATVMGIGQMVRGVGKSIGKLGKQIGAARQVSKEAKEDDNMADFYENEVKAGRIEAPQVTGRKKIPVEPGVTSSGFGIDNLKQHANIDNFEDGPFKGNLDNLTKASLYRQRAKAKRRIADKQVLGAVGTATGGMAGMAAGIGAAAFMGSGVQMTLAGVGADIGSSIGGFIGEHGSVKLTNLTNRKISGTMSTGVSLSGGATTQSASAVSRTDLSVPASENGVEFGGVDVEIDSSDLLMDSSNQTRSKEFYQWNEQAYKTCAAEAVRDLEASGVLDSNPIFNAARNDVHTKMEVLLQRAKNGESPESIIKGEDGFNEIRVKFNQTKVDLMQSTFSSKLEKFGLSVYSPNNAMDRAVVDKMVETMTCHKDKNGNAGQLYRNGRYMSNAFDKSYGITWNKYEQQILNECAKHGYTKA